MVVEPFYYFSLDCWTSDNINECFAHFTRRNWRFSFCFRICGQHFNNNTYTHTQNVIEPKMGKSFVYFDEFVFVLIVFRCFRSQLIIIETFLCIAATQITIRNFRNWPRLAALRVGCSFSTDFTLVFVRTVNTTLWHWLLSQNVRKIVKCILHRMDWIQFNWKTKETQREY